MRRLILAFYLLTTLAAIGGAEDWPQFRGPDGQGHSSETNLPLTWSESENIRWKVAVPGKGWSSPTILGNQIWLTTALDGGKSLRAICLDRNSGKVRHNVEVFHKANPGEIHQKNSHASPTPWLEEDRVYVHFGAHGTACLTRDGKILWKTVLKYAHRHGPAGSPIVVDDLLILSCDGTDKQFVVALDKHTGKERWRASRDGAMAYTTPLLIEFNGQRQVVSPGGEWCIAYVPETGKEIWRFHYPGGYSNVPRPVFGQGLVYICSGFNTPILYAVRPNGQGDITDTNMVWELKRGAPLNPSPLLVGEDLYLVSDKGIALCLDARTGQQHWTHRLGGNYSASPVSADGRIYFLDEDGTTTVIAPGTEYKELAKNHLPGRTLASPAVSDGAMYLRTDSHVYRIEHRIREDRG